MLVAADKTQTTCLLLEVGPRVIVCEAPEAPEAAPKKVLADPNDVHVPLQKAKTDFELSRNSSEMIRTRPRKPKTAFTRRHLERLLKHAGSRRLEEGLLVPRTSQGRSAEESSKKLLWCLFGNPSGGQLSWKSKNIES